MQEFVEDIDSLWKEGEKLEILEYPNPILKKLSKPIEKFDNQLEKLIKNLFYTMYNSRGIGLAAAQVGILSRVFVMDIDYERERITMADGTEKLELSNLNPQVFINPIFSDRDGEIFYEEGCLSVPGIYEKIKRNEKIKVSYQNLKGENKNLEAEGLHAICLQHENDHLDGVVFIDKLSSLKRSFYLKKIRKSHGARS